ncbi:Uncharacterized protein APZ42_022657 [Daphnia magna]|uniref:Uncharacterized protein n=1 Tax=Daphnia magna TaxID=35525 RepID=A0A164VNB8_9CRUS|nr:Uncharacterized protein APZ42_022657 [Daphnia magna]
MMLSQTARIFVANMDDFPGKLSDYIITTDSDLWPLKKEHFIQPEGSNRPLTLVHSQCCGPFTFDGRNYTMFPMSHIAASAATWKEIVNFNSSVVAKDSASILEYLKQVFGERVHRPVVFASEDWTKIERTEYRTRDCAGLIAFPGMRVVSNPLRSTIILIRIYLWRDFKPAVWESIKPLVLLMYGEGSSQIEWSNAYAKGFDEQFVKWKSSTSK